MSKKPDPENITLIQAIIKGDDPTRIEALVRSGQKVSSCDLGINVPLHIAISLRHNKTAKKLLELGADPKECDRQANNALHVAIQSGNTDFASSLIDREIAREDLDLTHRSNQGTALYLATNMGQLEIAGKIGGELDRRARLAKEASYISPQAPEKPREPATPREPVTPRAAEAASAHVSSDSGDPSPTLSQISAAPPPIHKGESPTPPAEGSPALSRASSRSSVTASPETTPKEPATPKAVATHKEPAPKLKWHQKISKKASALGSRIRQAVSRKPASIPSHNNIKMTTNPLFQASGKKSDHTGHSK